MSGNLGDTCNILPVLSGLYKYINEQFDITVNKKMEHFKGLKELMERQKFIRSFNFGTDYDANVIGLSSVYYEDIKRPYETQRYENFIRLYITNDFEVDDDFRLEVPYVENISREIVIGDRTKSEHADTRREFDVLKNSGKFSDCYFLDYSNDLITNLNVIMNAKKFYTTFTGIAVLSNLIYANTVLVYNDSLTNWDGYPIDKSFSQHFYRNRNIVLKHINGDI